MNTNLSISVVVPTYMRPDYLGRCVASLLAQSRLPDEIVIVSRNTDDATNRKIAELSVGISRVTEFAHELVSEAGFLPPIRKGLTLAHHSIVAFLDDDAEAHADWIQRLLAGYTSPEVAGVGGRYVNFGDDGKLASYPAAVKVGKVYWYGRSVGNMYRDVTFKKPVEVDFLIGGNMSFRRSVLERVEFDPLLNDNVAFHWEIDVALQVKRMGFRIMFDPALRVNHYNAPRPVVGMRSVNAEGSYWSNFNYAYIMMKHLPTYGKLAYVLFSFLVGGTRSSGVLHLTYQYLKRSKVDWKHDILPSLSGRVAGLLAYLRGWV